MSGTVLTVAMAQINPIVGAIEDNAELMRTAIRRARQQHVNVVVFPELALTGYPPEDLLLRPELYSRVTQGLAVLRAECPQMLVVVGAPQQQGDKIYNTALGLQHGKVVAEYVKQVLPNYSVFDEMRYFTAGHKPCIIEVAGARLGIMICEDGWSSMPARQAKSAGAEILIQLNASPYHVGKLKVRHETAAQRALETQLPLLCVYQVGGQDELIFDGHSFVCDGAGKIVHQAPGFVEDLAIVELHKTENGWQVAAKAQLPEALSPEAEMYQALVLAVQDYINKNGFSGALLGLSGGIDSALSLAIAVDALGQERVEAIMLPSRFTSELSNRAALQQIAWLGVKYRTIPIEAAVQAFSEILAPSFEGRAPDLTEENIQARCRGVILMALSNKFGRLVLTTSNKSEVAVGYSTLYGDMAGGFAVIKDVWKTWVYRLARYRNSLSPAIPDEVITRAPSAELRENQTDQDSLPDYAVLDAIMQLYVEENRSAADIIAQGYAEEAVDKAIHLLKRSQYKRQQGPLGPKVTKRGFGRDWRYPLTMKF